MEDLLDKFHIPGRMLGMKEYSLKDGCSVQSTLGIDASAVYLKLGSKESLNDE